MARKREAAWVATADRAAIGIVTVGALLVAAGMLVSFVVQLVNRVSTGEVSFPVLTDTPAPAALLGDGAGIVSTTVTHVQVVASDLSTGVFVSFILADAVGALTGIITALAIAFLGWRLLKGDPFRTSVIRTSLVAASVLIIAPFAQLLLSATATIRALVELAGPAGGRSDGLLFGTDLNLTPVLVGISLAVVLGVFEYGQKLRADTEGLV